jgi:hypothetical protein
VPSSILRVLPSSSLAIIRRDSHDVRLAHTASRSHWYSSTLTTRWVTSSLISLYLVISHARSQLLVSATVVWRIWKLPPGPVSMCQNHVGRVTMSESTVLLGPMYKSMMYGCWFGPYFAVYPKTVLSSLSQIHFAS